MYISEYNYVYLQVTGTHNAILADAILLIGGNTNAILPKFINKVN
jgi:hypothetical protein